MTDEMLARYFWEQFRLFFGFTEKQGSEWELDWGQRNSWNLDEAGGKSADLSPWKGPCRGIADAGAVQMPHGSVWVKPPGRSPRCSQPFQTAAERDRWCGDGTRKICWLSAIAVLLCAPPNWARGTWEQVCGHGWTPGITRGPCPTCKVPLE